MSGLQTNDVRRSQLNEDIAKMEAEMFGTPDSAEQEEQVLDDQSVVTPDESTPEIDFSTEELFDVVTVHEDTQKPSDEEESLRKQLADEKHRFNRYKGSTDRTLFDLRSEVTRLNQIIVANNKKIAELSEAKEPEVEISQDVRDVLGDETADEISGLKKEIHSLKSQLKAKDDDVHVTAAAEASAINEREFRSKLEELVPDLDAMNKDPEFNEWLRQPGSDGVDRIAVLRSDQARYDYTRVAEFFNGYKSEKKIKDSKKVKDTVDSHRGPKGTQSSSSVNRVSEKPGTIRMSEINKFNADVAKGLYKYDAVKADAMETKIFNAHQNDTIIYDVQPI